MRRLLPCLALVGLFGCKGDLALDPGQAPSTLPTVGQNNAANPTNPASVLGGKDGRRLSDLEVAKTLDDLMAELSLNGATVEPPPLAPADVRHQFSNTSDSKNFTYDQLFNIMTWVEGVSATATADINTLMGCDAPAAWDACTEAFTRKLGRLAWRRPLSDVEVGRFQAAYETTVAEGTRQDGVRAIVEMALMAPDFWYLSPQTREGDTRLSSHTVASRLSYALWGTMPDATLRAAADADELQTDEQIRAMAATMLDDPKAIPTVQLFHREWLHVKSPSELNKDPERFPDFNEDVAADLQTSFDEFVKRTVLDGGTVEDLLVSRFGYVNQRLEPILGIPNESASAQHWVWRDLGEQRSGIFTQPLFLASTSGSYESALIHRGVGVLEKTLCWSATPPANVSAEAIEVPPTATSGKLLGVESRASKANCSSCHDSIDPVGLAFETYDALGTPRTMYSDGVAIEPSGNLELGPISIAFSSVPDMMQKLSTQPNVKECYAGKWVEWTTGHPVTTAEKPELTKISQAETIRELILNVVTSPLVLNAEENAQ